MPTFAQNITKIERANSNYSRPQILDAFDEMVLIVYEQDMQQLIKIDSDTGMPPYLATEAGERNYLLPSDCRRTASIFVEDNDARYSANAHRGPFEEYLFRTTRYWKVPVDSWDADVDPDNALARLTFLDDPGATTTKYFHEYYLKYTNMTDESQRLLIQEKYHYLLRKGVLALLADEDYGESGQGINTVKLVAKEIRNEMNRGARSRLQRTPWQEENRSDSDLGYYV